MSEIISIKLKVDNNLAKTLRLISDKYDIDKDIIDLTPNNINLVLDLQDAIKIGNVIGDLIEVLVLVKSLTSIIKN